jgi:hypothetical protein
MITQAGVSKFQNLLTQIQWWGGPTDVAMYFRSKAEILLLENFIETNRAWLENVTFHAMLEKTRKKTDDDDLQPPYPNNLLRNLVLDNLRTDYYVALDVDFIPNHGSYQALYHLIHNNNTRSRDVKRRLHYKHVFVFPAFALKAPPGQDSPTRDMLPQNKRELIQLEKQGKLEQFRPGGDGHKPTNYTQFYRGSRPDGTGDKAFHDLDYNGCGTYEPYVLAYRHGSPRYWNELRSGYMNKVAFFKEMSRAGFHYTMLLDFWVVHMDHPYPTDDAVVKERYIAYNKPHWREFKTYLNRWYPSLPCMRLKWEDTL